MSQNFKEKITEQAIGEFEEKFGRKPDEVQLSEYMLRNGHIHKIQLNDMTTRIMLSQPVVRSL
ncbi:MAG: hypothetical protein L6Q54_11770 [Leptospiraceae bacterium]|nr:hypothetical protein [Leptospiraceae bacterium]